MCNDTLFKELSDSNQLTIDDIINCYRPECEHGAYKSRQCFRIGSRAEQKKYCWCSSESGANIADTLKVVTATDPSVDCSKSEFLQLTCMQSIDIDCFANILHYKD